MSSRESSVTIVEQVTRAVYTALTVLCFLGMVAVAVHILTDPRGPLEAHRLYYGNLTNFVDPIVSSSVRRTGTDQFEYHFQVSNGPWGFQDIREVALPVEERGRHQATPDWQVSLVSIGVGSVGTIWSLASEGTESRSLKRGGDQAEFVVRSNALPVIMPLQAGHDLRFDGLFGLSSNLSTPSGRRITRWVVGPNRGRADLSPAALLGSLVPGVHRASELKWIRDPSLSSAIRGTLTLAAADIKAGEISRATVRLERLLQVVQANAGVQLSEEALALIVHNVEYVIKAIDPPGLQPEGPFAPASSEEFYAGKRDYRRAVVRSASELTRLLR